MLVNHTDHRGRGDERKVTREPIKFANYQLSAALTEAAMGIIAGIRTMYILCPQ